MDDLRKAAEMALEALEDSMYPQKKQFDAIVGLKQALAQEEQEPVELKNLRDVHAAQGSDGTWNSNQYMCGLFNGLELALSIFENREPLYKELSQPEQEPVAAVELITIGSEQTIAVAWHDSNAFKLGVKLYTAPPSKPWVSLTDDEMKEIWEGHGYYVTLFKKIEAKLKEKNGF